MNKAEVFYFRKYGFDTTNNSALFTYAIDEQEFSESFTFAGEFKKYDDSALDSALQILFLITGVSYYKALLPKKIVDEQKIITEEIAQFLSKTYSNGLREFFYVNHLPVDTEIEFPVSKSVQQPITTTTKNDTFLVAIGGGKDSLVSYEMLQKANKDIVTWSLGHKAQLTPLVEKMESVNHMWVDRKIDKKLLELNEAGAYNGHVPISAIFAAVSTVMCVLTQTKDAVFSNEQSASEPTIVANGIPVNHQYSKSIEFEIDYQNLLSSLYGDNLRYYSLLRPHSEAKISQIFCGIALSKYHDVFSSCNRAFTQNSTKLSWCGNCAKCAFIFLAFTPFAQPQDVQALWHGQNLLVKPELHKTYQQLLGLTDDGKPFDRVGEIKESRTLMNLAKDIYPDFDFDYYEIPSDYDWQSLMPHVIPDDIFYGTLQQKS